MVPTDRQIIRCHKQIADLTGPKWPRYAIAQVDLAIDVAMLDVGEHCFQRRQVPMDVGYNGDTHRTSLRTMASEGSPAIQFAARRDNLLSIVSP